MPGPCERMGFQISSVSSSDGTVVKNTHDKAMSKAMIS
jgi:hypothetical protein